MWTTSKGEVRFLAPTWARASERGERWGKRDSWRETDAALRSIARRRAALDAEEAEWLLKARDQQIHLYLGLPTFLAYLENALGYSPRTAQDKLRVAEALANQPALKDELASCADAVSALVNLSFPKGRARAAVEAVAAHVGAGAPVEEIVRAALRQLRS